MEAPVPHLIKEQKPVWPVYLWRIIIHPIQSARGIATWQTVLPGLIVTLAFGIYQAAGCSQSYFNHDYPPPPESLSVWIQTWGEFSMLPLPFLRFIPLDQYRLFMAAVSLPVAVGSWLYMAGIARVLTRWFGSHTRFSQYLNLFAFSFFPFWLLASLGDGIYSAVLGPYVVPGLTGEYGPLAQAFFSSFPPLLWTLMFGMGAVYNGLVAYAASSGFNKLRWWRSALIGWGSFLLPLALVSILFR